MTLAQVHLMFSYCPWTTEKALPRAHRDTPEGEQVGSVAPCRGSHGRVSVRGCQKEPVIAGHGTRWATRTGRRQRGWCWGEAVGSWASLCLGEVEVLLILSERGGGWGLGVHSDLASGLGRNRQWPSFASSHHGLRLPCLGVASGRLCPKGGPRGLAMRARWVPVAASVPGPHTRVSVRFPRWCRSTLTLKTTRYRFARRGDSPAAVTQGSALSSGAHFPVALGEQQEGAPGSDGWCHVPTPLGGGAV